MPSLTGAPFLDALIGRIFSKDVEIPITGGLDFKGGLVAARNDASNVVEVQIDGAGVTPDALAAENASGFAPAQVLRVSFVAGTPGTADDVAIVASAPYGFRILDAWADVSTGIGASTVQLRSATGGGGTALSSALASATVSTARTSSGSSHAVASGGTVFLRRTDRGVAGEVFMLVCRT